MNGGRNGKVRRTAFQTASGPGTSDRPGPGLTVYAQLAGIVLFWGANWPLMKLALVDIGPLAFCAVRLFGTALSVAALAPILRFPLLPQRGERLMLAVVVLSSNLGDNRTLAIPVAQTIFHEMGAARRAEMGIADGLVRVSVGIEDEADLVDDFAQALA